MTMYRPHRLCRKENKPKEPSLYRSLCISILSMFLSTVMLVGTTFAWFDSSVTSAVSTITAGGLNVSTSYITQNTALAHRKEEAPKSEANEITYSYDDIGTLGWIPFSGNGGNPFGSISVTPESPQIVFLKVENKNSYHAIYRLSLNLLGNISADQSGNNLFFGYQVLKPTDDSLISTESLCKFSIPSEDGSITAADSYTGSATGTNDDSTAMSVTAAGTFYGDALSAHGATDDNTAYGGNLCVVDLPGNSTKYIAVALYMDGGSSETTPSSLLIQLSMTVNQFGAENPLMPNVVGSNTITQQDLDAVFSVMYGELLAGEDEIPVVDEPTPVEDGSKADTETPAKPGDTTDQPDNDTEKTPASSETPTAPTTETENTTGTSESGTPDASGGSGDTTVTENGSET